MHLKYIKLQGFKSFPDKIKMDFHEGITSILGPNGSGKSNVSDAIRWVMGEQSVKSLRGNKMEDIIFSGTIERKPLSFAEVSMCFDNTDRALNIDFDEVMITRRVFRSGEGEYFINRSACRLKDIHELLMDTGLGRDGYSVISQGKIDELIMSKSEDKRILFEEASGITKYRYRKGETQRKLEQTQENLIRISDIISEIESRLDPLRQKAQTARKYLDMREKLKQIEVSLAAINIERINISSTKLKNQFENIETQIEICKNEITDLESQSSKFFNEMGESDRIFEITRKSCFDLEKNLSDIKNEVLLLENNISFSNENVERIQKEIEKINEVLKENAEKITENSLIKNSLNDKITVAHEQLMKLEKKQKNLSSNMATGEDRANEISRSILSLMGVISEIKIKLGSLNAKTESLNKRQDSILDESVKNESEAERICSKISESKQLKDMLVEQIGKEEEAVTHLKNQLEKTSSLLAVLKDRDNNHIIEFNKAESEKKMLEDMERYLEGYSKSVKAVIKESRDGSLHHIRVEGTVSQIIDVSSRYVTAVETALGSMLQNIITNTEEDAKIAIDYLKQSKNGRATFLPMSAVSGEMLDDSKLKIEKGYIDLASRLVEYDKKYEGIIQYMLGKVIVVDNIDNAIALAGKNSYKLRIVTLEGELLVPGGSISGGNTGKSGGFLSRNTRMKELAEIMIEMEKQNLQLKSEIFDTVETLKVCNEKIHNVQKLLSDKQEELQKTKNKAEHFAMIKGQLEILAAQLEQERKFNDEQMQKIKDEIDVNEAALKEYNGQILKLQADVDYIKKQNEDITSEKENISKDILDASLALSSLHKDLEIIKHQISLTEEVIQEAKKQKNMKNTEVNALNAKNEDTKMHIKSYEGKTFEIIKQIDAKKQELQNMQEKKMLSEESAKEGQTQIKEKRNELLKLTQEEARLENRLVKTQTELDDIYKRLWDEYELTYSSSLEIKQEIVSVSKAQKEVSELRKDIKSLGEVTVGSISEYSEVSQRYEFLTNQKNDLVQAKQSLNHVIDELVLLMKKQFKEQFGIINKVFNEVFQELFGGGGAELILTDPENILESGIEINAQPPGKKLQNLLLFSGGEKAFIAIALLFSILKVRPSPFCILDEIEAALDDINVYRFASYLRSISDRTQFVVVTHRRGTMEASDMLYGVTMQEKGISKLLALDINEINRTSIK